MADKMTKKKALDWVIEMIQDISATDSTLVDDDAFEVIIKMREQLDKPHAATPSKSNARIENESIANQLAESIAVGTEVDGAYVMNHTIAMTPQKVVGIMKVAVELGYFERNKVGKQVIYTRV